MDSSSSAGFDFVRNATPNASLPSDWWDSNVMATTSLPRGRLSGEFSSGAGPPNLTTGAQAAAAGCQDSGTGAGGCRLHALVGRRVEA
jgi:hypothetical protein